MRLTPLGAPRPGPGARVSQGVPASRKQWQRARWSRLPPLVAAFLSCGLAPARIAAASSG